MANPTRRPFSSRRRSQLLIVLAAVALGILVGIGVAGVPGMGLG